MHDILCRHRLVKHMGTVSTPDPWETYLSQIEGLEIIDPAGQLELWHVYAQGREDAAGSGERRASDEAYLSLVGANFRLVSHVMRDKLKKRFPSGVSREIRSEAGSEANLAMCDAIVKFDPGRNWSLPGWIALNIERRLSDFLSDDRMPASWQKVARIAAGVESGLSTELGRTPSIDELREAVKAHCMDWARSREDGVVLDDSEAKRKLVRQGTWAAIERLDEVMAAGMSVVSLDLESESGGSLLDVLGEGGDEDAVEVLGWFLQSLGEESLSLVVRRFGLDGGEAQRYEDIAEELGVAWTEVRSQIVADMGRMWAPHAHYASLADLGEQIEIEQDESSAASRLAARLGRGTGETLG